MHLPKRSAQLRAIAFLTLVCLSLIGMEAWSIWTARQVQIQEATTATSNMTRSLAQHAHDTVRTADSILLGLVERVEQDGTSALALMRLHRLLQARAAQLPLINGILVYDATGRWIATSLATLPPNVNNADREYFQYHKANPARGAHIGPPVKSRSTGRWVIPLSRRIDHADGSFAGVALTTIEMAYFARFHDSFDIGGAGTIFLAIDDGTMLARRPFDATAIGKNISEGPVFTQLRRYGPGTAMLTAKFDGIERLYSYRRVDDYPLVVAMAVSKNDLLADWRQASLLSATAISLLIGGLVILGLRLIRQIRVRETVERRLQHSEARLRAISDNLPALVTHVDRDERYTFVNSHVERVFGIKPESMIGRDLRQISGAGLYATIAPHVQACLAGNHASFEGVVQARGSELIFQANYIPEFGTDGSVSGFYAMTFDITALKRSEQKRIQSEERLRLITDNLPVLIAYLDVDHRFQFCNATFKQWLGVDPADLIGKKVAEAIGDDAYRQRIDYLDRAFNGETVHFEMSTLALGVPRVLQTVYVPHKAADGSVNGLCTISTDVTALKEKEQELTILARSDALTGLPNRRQFDDRLEQALARCGRTDHAMALMYLDIDHFKHINDSSGHATGDAVLRQFASRLAASVRRTDLVARLAGDEFVIIIDAFKQPHELRLIARKILAAIRLPMPVEGGTLHVTASIGVTVFDRHDVLAGPIMARADQALYEAKSAGRDCVCEWQAPAPVKDARDFAARAPERLQ